MPFYSLNKAEKIGFHGCADELPCSRLPWMVTPDLSRNSSVSLLVVA